MSGPRQKQAANVPLRYFLPMINLQTCYLPQHTGVGFPPCARVRRVPFSEMVHCDESSFHHMKLMLKI